MNGEGFTSAELQPLGEQDVRAFVHHWHEAVRSETVDAEERDRLTRYEAELTRKLTGQRHLLALAATPLLCALLCALYRDRHTALPRDRMEVYEAALAMLLKDRDLQRGIDHGVDLSRSEQVLLLQELAKWLIINGASDAPVETARRQTGRVLATMHRVEYPPEKVFDHLVVRSGLLQTPAVDRVSFLHRTFEEYLAAKALVEDDSLPLLVRNAHDDQWHETVVMAAGHANPAQREELIRGLLARSDGEKRNQDRLLLVAFACLETSPRLSEELRKEIHTRVRSLLPPRKAAHVRALALVGEAALPLLAAQPPTNAAEARWTIEAAGLIGGPDSAAIIDRALENRSHQVFLAAQRVWRADQGDELAAVFLPRAVARHADYYNPIPADRIDLAVRHMSGAPRLCLEGRTGNTLDGVARMPGIEIVHLRNRPDHAWHGIDLAPLGGLEQLTGLEVYANAYAASVSPLRRTPLKELLLSHPSRTADLEAVRDFDHLEYLGFSGTVPAAPLDALLPSGLQRLELTSLWLDDLRMLKKVPNRVTRLKVANCRDLGSLEGIESQAETLTEFCHRAWIETVDLGPLRKVPGLARLRLDLFTAWRNIGHLTRIPGLRLLFLELGGRNHEDLSWVREVPGLETLCLQHSGTLDLTSLAGMRGLTVHVRRGRRIIGADQLGEGSTVIRGFPEEVFPW
ncbi:MULTISPECIES: NACHT domain-containing protein [unclassified Nocardiopsis]|uniref:NACHT domain-containing protein n=1 Tax=Nocardiopsis TaxID=2013 RepID=UPI00387B97FF